MTEPVYEEATCAGCGTTYWARNVDNGSGTECPCHEEDDLGLNQ